MKKKLIIIISILVAILLGIGIYFGIKTINLKKYRVADTYTVKGEEITSVKAVLGEKELKKYSYEKENTETLVLTFVDSDKEQSAKKYIEHLKDNGNYIEMKTEDKNKNQIAKSGKNSKDLVTVESECTEDGFTVTIMVGPGAIKLDSVE